MSSPSDYLSVIRLVECLFLYYQVMLYKVIHPASPVVSPLLLLNELNLSKVTLECPFLHAVVLNYPI